MSFLSILKAVGKGLGIVQSAKAVIAPILPSRVNTFLDAVIGAVVRAEQAASRLAEIGTAIKGEGKLALADAFFSESLDIAELVSGREIGDNEKFQRGVAAITAGRKQVLSGTADILDSLKG